ncbi:DMT family transporter [Pseudoflavonifractor sp. AF19-9AC]|uniref:DMT family transporter n=1 Tax=Pseudoflavonifractor sp. AF19-9AC TaxID=2292244 RepID=UPI000E4D6888|nr:DMT family transporter [Pseudoflavonifractor sp. AF19-9AC]RHR05585.1 DMT family transporter [Pseudoflavonifractor sp. AF19-9AC]
MKKEYLFAGISILSWASTAAVGTLMMDSLSQFALVFYTSLTAAVFLLILVAATGRLPLLRTLHLKDLFRMSALGILGMFLMSLFFYNGLARLEAQQAYIINYLWPILIVVFSWLILRKPITAQTCLALLLSFFGVIIVATEGNLANLGGVDFGGVISCLLGACCYALFAVFNTQVKCDKFVAMLVYYTSTTLVSLVFLAAQEPVPILSAVQWGGTIWLGMVTNGLAYTTWALSMDLGNTAKLSNLAYLTPFLSLVYIFFLLHEPILLSSYLGLVFILAGVLLQVWKFPARRPRAARTQS